MVRLAATALALLVTTAAPTSAASEDFVGLNCGTTIITGTVDPELSRGLRELLATVAIKLTGDREAGSDDIVQRLPKSPNDYVERLELEDRMKGIPIHDEQGTRERPHFLRVCFDREGFSNALVGQGLALWPEPRPTVRIELAVHTPNSAYVVRSEGPEGYGQRLALDDTAEERGVPIALPSIDDQTADPDRVTAALFGELPPSSADDRGTSPTLYGDLQFHPDAGNWNAEWRLSTAGRLSERFSEDSISFDEAIRFGIDRAIRILRGD